jgi:putative addiction module component (TIGR02574 family)
MASTPDDILSSVLRLPAERRAQIARELLASLDEDTDPGAAEEWVREVEQRAAEVASGTAKTEPWAAVRARGHR